MTTFETVDDIRGLLVKVGLGSPAARAFVLATATAAVAYVAKFPGAAFREDGSMKPLKYLSPEPDATHTHFLLVPVAVAGAAYLFT